MPSAALLVTTLIVALAPTLGLAEDWKPPEEPRAIPPEMFKLADPSLEVTVWASFPQLYNPTNMDINHRSQIWVAEGAKPHRGAAGSRWRLQP